MDKYTKVDLTFKDDGMDREHDVYKIIRSEFVKTGDHKGNEKIRSQINKCVQLIEELLPKNLNDKLGKGSCLLALRIYGPLKAGNNIELRHPQDQESRDQMSGKSGTDHSVGDNLTGIGQQIFQPTTDCCGLDGEPGNFVTSKYDDQCQDVSKSDERIEQNDPEPDINNFCSPSDESCYPSLTESNLALAREVDETSEPCFSAGNGRLSLEVGSGHQQVSELSPDDSTVTTGQRFVSIHKFHKAERIKNEKENYPSHSSASPDDVLCDTARCPSLPKSEFQYAGEVDKQIHVPHTCGPGQLIGTTMHLQELKIATRYDLVESSENVIPKDGFEFRRSTSFLFDANQGSPCHAVPGEYEEVDLQRVNLKESPLSPRPRTKWLPFIREFSEESDEDWGFTVSLGAGGFAKIYKATHYKTGRIMAMKDCLLGASFSREVEIMSSLCHSNIISYMGHTTLTGMDGSVSRLIFMEWMAGGSIESWLKEIQVPFSEDVIENYLYQILQGVAHMHDNGFVHCDIKGANILIDSTGEIVKICDFGLAVSHADLSCANDGGKLKGTYDFMAPELFDGGKHSEKSDVWSVGCVANQMATNDRPWGKFDNEGQLIYRVCDKEPQIPSWLSEWMQNFIRLMMTKDPSKRPSAADLILLMDKKKGNSYPVQTSELCTSMCSDTHADVF